MKKKIFKTDWLASRPIFYNEKTCKISENINDVIDYRHLEFDPEGFNNYLDFGYSVFEQTPVKNVKFCRYASELSVKNGQIVVQDEADPIEKWNRNIVSELTVLDLIKYKVQAWERSVKGSIIVPTSGGYDSRLLNVLIEDKKRIRSFTFGISDVQSQSFEVMYAKKLSISLGTRWEQIKLGNFHNYFDYWNSLYGPSVHSHGMYQIEFYKKINSKIGGGHPFLSGIYGDAWAGSISFQKLKSPMELKNIGYTHGMNADISMSLFSTDYSLRYDFWKKNIIKINDPLLQIVMLLRLKMVLISYLLRLPRILGNIPYAPYLDEEIARSMLHIKPERRKERIWIKEYFGEKGLFYEDQNIKVDTGNTLNFQALLKRPLVPLNAKLLREFIKPSYIELINNRISKLEVTDYIYKGFKGVYKHEIIRNLLTNRIMNYLLYKRDVILQAYCAYLTLKPIEYTLLRREEV